ncbi:polymorphic toxin-type HINT domain-containing protein [Streptomyces sp. NPDC007883]|uniref:polymorphic toxin-type HINT domain-containing protein n=1 Tax=Streptomyces sp. NPDC007883 TaxID=3155116 RepID=UPI0033D15616
MDLPWLKVLKGAKALGKGAKCDSFVAGTQVLLADGSKKPIEELEPGDEVLATDPETGRTETKTVTAAIRTGDDKQYVDLTIATAHGPATITTTDHHPFWSQSEQAWLDAGDLSPGMTLRTDTGATVAVHAIRAYSAQQATYNLTVNDLHTYYVLAGETPVLVHNSNGKPCGVPNLKAFPDVSGLRGANVDDVLDSIPDHWTVSTPKKLPPGGEGIKFANPKAPGQSIVYESGWPGHADPLHRGPYLRISDGTQGVYRIPLAGNPAL